MHQKEKSRIFAGKTSSCKYSEYNMLLVLIDEHVLDSVFRKIKRMNVYNKNCWVFYNNNNTFFVFLPNNLSFYIHIYKRNIYLKQII